MTRQNVSTGDPGKQNSAYSRAVRVGQSVRVSGTTAMAATGLVGKGDPHVDDSGVEDDRGSARREARRLPMWCGHVFIQAQYRSLAGSWAGTHGGSSVRFGRQPRWCGGEALDQSDMLVEIEADAIIGSRKATPRLWRAGCHRKWLICAGSVDAGDEMAHLCLIAEVGPCAAAPRSTLSIRVTGPCHCLSTTPCKGSGVYSREFMALCPGRRFRSTVRCWHLNRRGFGEAGFSRAKVAALQDLAVKTIDGTVPTAAVIRRLEDDAIVERLMAVRGIGRVDRRDVADLSAGPSLMSAGR